MKSLDGKFSKKYKDGDEMLLTFQYLAVVVKALGYYIDGATMYDKNHPELNPPEFRIMEVTKL